MANLGFGPVDSGAVSGGSAAAAPAVGAGNLGLGPVASGTVSGGVVAIAPPIVGAGNLGFGAVASDPVAGGGAAVVIVPAGGVVGIIRASQVVMEVLLRVPRRTHLRPYLQINT